MTTDDEEADEATQGQPLLRVDGRVAIPLAEIVLRTSRSSGPGGQHANVTSSRVEAIFDVLASPSLSETQRARILDRAGPRVVAIAQDERSQLRNRELALRRLKRASSAGAGGAARAARHAAHRRLAHTTAGAEAQGRKAQGAAPPTIRRRRIGQRTGAADHAGAVSSVQQLLHVALVQPADRRLFRVKVDVAHTNPDTGAHATIRYTPTNSTATRTLREPDSAASGSAHSTYQGSTQLSVTSSAILAHADAVMESRLRHA